MFIASFSKTIFDLEFTPSLRSQRGTAEVLKSCSRVVLFEEPLFLVRKHFSFCALLKCQRSLWPDKKGR